ncbi:MAG: glycosyltransferase family 2 protein [Pseudomonadota bacterium]
MVKVSVILPTYNRAHVLSDACRSVLSQTVKDIELIIVDDASQDDTKKVADCLRDARVRYIRHERNRGVSAARNTGLSLSRGLYIAFQDSDDLWLPGKLARQLGQLETLPRDVGAVTGSKIVFGRDSSWNYAPGLVTCAPPPENRMELQEDQVRKLLTHNRISVQNALFRRSCFPGIEWFDPCAKANEDWEFSVRLVQHTKVFEEIDPVVLAFVSEDSISKSNNKKALGLVRIIKNNHDLFRRHHDLYALHLLQLGRLMFRCGRYRWSGRFLLSGLKRRPAVVVSLLPQICRFVLKRGFGHLQGIFLTFNARRRRPGIVRRP